MVSIQLLSPASGETDKFVKLSIIPSEFPFNYFPQRVGSLRVSPPVRRDFIVSIQLLSPASGEQKTLKTLQRL